MEHRWHFERSIGEEDSPELSIVPSQMYSSNRKFVQVLYSYSTIFNDKNQLRKKYAKVFNALD